MYCNNCGNNIPDEARFCAKCGAPVAAQDSEPQQAADQAPADQPTYQAPEDQPTYQAPRPPAPPHREFEPGVQRTNALSITGFVLSLVGLCCCWIPIIGAVIALTGLILSIVGVVKPQQKKGMAIAGIIIGAIALIAGIVYSIALLFVIANVDFFSTEFPNLSEFSFPS